MKRVFWTTDLSEALIVEGLLRAHGLHAWAFDTALIRQDWFQILAFGGYRLMAADADAAAAAGLVASYRSGDLALDSPQHEAEKCPRCRAANVSEDPQPRRVIFALLIAFDWMVVIPWTLGFSDASIIATGCVSVLGGLLLALPGVLAFIVRCRYRCRNCFAAWRWAPLSYLEMTQAVDAADAAGSMTHASSDHDAHH